MGIAKALGTYAGRGEGAIGKMFSDGIDRLYQKSVKNVNAAISKFSPDGFQREWSDREKDTVATGLKISELFAKLDVSDSNSLADDFKTKLSEMRNLVQEHAPKFNVSESYLGLAGDAAGIMKYFQGVVSRV